MADILHITSGDIAGDSLLQSDISGDLLVWHDILYDGPRKPGWPDQESLRLRAEFLENVTGGGLAREQLLKSIGSQYEKIRRAAEYKRIVLWFDACVFDQSMLAHILVLLRCQSHRNVELICIDAYPGIEPFNGLGQLEPAQLASLYDRRRQVSDEQYLFAEIVDRAFAEQDVGLLNTLSNKSDAVLPWVPAAVARWLLELPDPKTGLGRLDSLALAAIRNGCRTPWEIFAVVAENDTPPQYWGDITLWAKINGLAEKNPPLVQITGPTDRLPQWETSLEMKDFSITPVS